jgi:hypothetical protein
MSYFPAGKGEVLKTFDEFVSEASKISESNEVLKKDNEQLRSQILSLEGSVSDYASIISNLREQLQTLLNNKHINIDKLQAQVFTERDFTRVALSEQKLQQELNKLQQENKILKRDLGLERMEVKRLNLQSNEYSCSASSAQRHDDSFSDYPA